MSDEKKRFFPARVSSDGTVYYSGGEVFTSIEEARKKAQQPPNESRWAVLELHAIDPPEAAQSSRVILEYATVATHQSGCEIIYDRNGFRSAGEMCKADPEDVVYYATLIDYAGKEEEKEDFVMTFFRDASGWRSGYLQPAETKTGWVCDEYRVKVQLPKIREVPRAN